MFPLILTDLLVILVPPISTIPIRTVGIRGEHPNRRLRNFGVQALRSVPAAQLQIAFPSLNPKPSP